MVGTADCTNANLEGRGDIPPALAGSPAFDYLDTIKDDVGSADSGAIFLGGLNASGNTLPDQLTLELGTAARICISSAAVGLDWSVSSAWEMAINLMPSDCSSWMPLTQ